MDSIRLCPINPPEAESDKSTKPIDEVKQELTLLKTNIREIKTDVIYIKHYIEKLVLEKEKKQLLDTQTKQQGWFFSY
tara:strand:- start:11 stop:244 length:234 start_codon:yes stop_codon:yes gene_type:complete